MIMMDWIMSGIILLWFIGLIGILWERFKSY
jgi:hypothetical protein